MNQTHDQEELMHRYLLGELSEEEQMVLEREYFADTEKFEQVWAVENELIDSYVRGRLSRRDREQFERHYLATPQHRQRVAFAKTLLAAADHTEAEAKEPIRRATETGSWWQAFIAFLRGPQMAMGYGFAAVMLLLLLGSAWLLFDRVQVRQQLARVQADQIAQQRRSQELEQQLTAQRTQSDQLAAELERLREEQSKTETAGTPSPSILPFLLTAGFVRSGGQQPPLTIPPGRDIVELRIKTDDFEFPRYQAKLRQVGGREVLSRQNLAARTIQKAPAVVLSVPAKKLAHGDYILTLTGLNEAGETQESKSYFFRVSNQ
jgi:hypothetical protein